MGQCCFPAFYLTTSFSNYSHTVRCHRTMRVCAASIRAANQPLRTTERTPPHPQPPPPDCRHARARARARTRAHARARTRARQYPCRVCNDATVHARLCGMRLARSRAFSRVLRSCHR
eukprot:4072659-Pleurochrysis_carterae.AAC.9